MKSDILDIQKHNRVNYNKAMKKLKKEDINQEVFDLYDDYAHNKIERRQFKNKHVAKKR